MATVQPIGYNPGQTGVTGTSTVGDLTVGSNPGAWSGNPGGIRWWNTPDQDLGYVIAHTTAAGNQPTRPGITPANGYLGFWRTKVKTDDAFISLAQFVARKAGTPQSFASGATAKSWLNTNGYWTSWQGIVTDGLVIQLDAFEADSYPGSGNTVYDITGNYDHTLVSAPYTLLSGKKCFDCNGATTKIEVVGTGPTLPTNGYTYISWARIKTSSADWRTLFRTLPDDHPILVEVGTDRLGFYDNGGASFIYSGYDVTPVEDVWVQYTVVGDNASSAFYINGSQVGSSVSYGAGGNRHWVWGGLGGQPFGYVANMYLYNRKLTLAEINQQYNYLSLRFA